MKQVKITIECEECAGTGLYVGCSELDRDAVVCVRCDGTGCVNFHYRPFTKQHGRRGIDRVYRAYQYGGAPLEGGRPWITYKEFRAGKRP